MAPIYTARHIGSNDKTIPLFTLRGLNNLAPAPLSSLPISGIPLEKQLAYSQYVDGLEYFIHATSKKAKTLISGNPLGYLNTNARLPLSAPPVQFTLQKEISTDKADQFVTTLGSGSSKEKVGQTTIYSSPTINEAKLETIIQVSSLHYNAGRDAITPIGLKAFNFLSGCIAEFLKCHTYPAFHSESPESIVEIFNLIGDYDGGASQYKTKDIDLKTKSRMVRVTLPPADISMIEGDDDEGALQRENYELAQKSKGYIEIDGNDSVSVAKPSPGKELNFGSTTTVPFDSGNLFPYFDGLIQPDFVSLSNLVIRRFFRLLGATVQECQEMYSKLRRGLNSLATTKAGMALSHIALGIELALQTQGRCYCIFETDRYNGFVLLGARYAIFDGIKWHASELEDELQSDLTRLDPHANAVENLVSKFIALTAAQVYTGPTVTKKTFEQPSDLVEVFKGLKLEEVSQDDESELDRNIRCLNYMGKSYLAKDPGQIAGAIELLFSETAVKLERPTYIPSVRVDLESRSFIVLSRFGPDAPSMWNERGQEFVCSGRETTILTSGGKRKASEEDIYANMPVKILVTPKPIVIAVRDMDKIRDRGAIRIDLKERAGKYRSICIESEAMRKRMWKVLVEGMKEHQNKKRKVDATKDDTSKNKDFEDLFAGLLG